MKDYIMNEKEFYLDKFLSQSIPNDNKKDKEDLSDEQSFDNVLAIVESYLKDEWDDSPESVKSKKLEREKNAIIGYETETNYYKSKILDILREKNLLYEAQMIKASMLNTDIDIMLENIDNINDIPNGTYKERLVKTRVGQEFFRKSVLNSYNNRCCITGISNNDLLVASHIKPWRVSNEENERTNPTNGLCLNGLHDKAFDKGLITISRNYKVIISSSLKDTVMDDATAEWFFSYENNTIELPDKFLPNKEFIEYHNDAIFIR